MSATVLSTFIWNESDFKYASSMAKKCSFIVNLSSKDPFLWIWMMFPVGDCADLYFVSMISFQLDLLLCRGSASLSMWAKQVSRWEMPAGSSSAWSMVLGLMASSWTLQLKQTLEKILSTLSSTLGALGVTFHERYTWTWSPLWLVSSFDYVLFLPSLFFLLSFGVQLSVVISIKSDAFQSTWAMCS